MLTRVFMGFMCLAMLSSGCSSSSQSPPIVMGRVSAPLPVDGDALDYPGNPITVAGAEVRLAHDGSTLYVHVSAEAQGWLGVGFNSQGGGMGGANIIMGYLSGDHTPVISDEVGKAMSHSPASRQATEDFHVSGNGSRLVMEFSYPMEFPAGEGYRLDGLAPGETYSLIVAYAAWAQDPLARHTARAKVDFLVE